MDDERNRFLNMTEDILDSPIFLETRKQRYHGKDGTLYRHLTETAWLSFRIGTFLRMDEERLTDLTRAALLHDFCGYDWREEWYQKFKAQYHGLEHLRHMHTTVHGEIAADRAKMYFDITPAQYDIILSHMFPLTNHFPKTEGAWVLVLSDKAVAAWDLLKALGRILRRFFRERNPEPSRTAFVFIRYRMLLHYG